MKRLQYKGWYTYYVHENCPNFKTPHPLVHLLPNSFHPLDLGRPILDEPQRHHPLQMITNQLKENIIQGWCDYYMLSGPFFRLAFVFSMNPLLMSGFPLSSFHLVEASLLYLLLRGFSLLYVQLYENIKKCLLFIIIRTFSTHFTNNLFYLHTWKR